MNTFQAEAIARCAHQGQKYGERDYVDAHIVPVVDRVIAAGGSPDVVVVAWLHDVLEDNPEAARSWQDSPRMVLTRAQALALNAITRKPDEDYDLYIERVVADPLARLVKYCDLLQNLSCDPKPTLRVRYLRALQRVREKVDLAEQIPIRGMVRMAAAAAAAIDANLGADGLWHRQRAQRAHMVLVWCEDSGWPTDENLTPTRLETAMQAMPYWSQGPANYFDMARALNAVLLLP